MYSPLAKSLTISSYVVDDYTYSLYLNDKYELVENRRKLIRFIGTSSWGRSEKIKEISIYNGSGPVTRRSLLKGLY